jgi:RHS repeat-associated protein
LHGSGFERKFVGNSFDDESRFYDMGARAYHAGLARFVNPEPLYRKYPMFNPYLYGANNPLKFVDDDGRELKFAKGSTESFMVSFQKAVAYMHYGGNKYGNVFSELAKSPTIITIAPTTGIDIGYDESTKTIYWNPEAANAVAIDPVSGGGFPIIGEQSPATGLLHEGVHALDDINSNLDHSPDAQYEDKAEANAIQNYETPFAKSVGEGTRNSHRGMNYKTSSPTSTNKVRGFTRKEYMDSRKRVKERMKSGQQKDKVNSN